MGQTSNSVDWVAALLNSYGVVMVDAKDKIKINSSEHDAQASTAPGSGPPGFSHSIRKAVFLKRGFK